MTGGRLPYFSQSYFTPDFFPTLVAQNSGSTTDEPGFYFAHSYFAPDYFSPLGKSLGPSGVGWNSAFRDRDAFLGLSRILQGTGELRHVAIGAGVDRVRRSDNALPFACITPTSWTESDEYSSFSSLRTVQFKVSIVVRSDDPGRAFDCLDRLSNVVVNTINCADLGGTSVPSLTRVRQGRIDACDRVPELCATLDGEFSYLVATTNSHSVHF